jgi:membrane fusion protein (multidrug efflux system)
MKTATILLVVLGLSLLSLAGCQTQAQERPAEEQHKIVVTSPKVQEVVTSQQYVCQIHSRRHIDIRALVDGYLEQIPIKEGQTVKAGDVLFRILPTLYRAKWDAELAEVRTAQVELEQSQGLFQKRMVSQVDVALHDAQLKKAEAKAKLAEAELNFTTVVAPFDGIIDRLYEQQGSLVDKADMLTTLSDNSVMWVYFNVPEARYLEYIASHQQGGNGSAGTGTGNESEQIYLVLANGTKFPQTGTIGAIEADFNNETGNIAFRADFPNPNGLLRHGQTGTVFIDRVTPGAVVIPQRACYEILDKRFVNVVGEDGVVHPREIVVQHEMEDIFVIKSGLAANDKFVLEGVQQVHDGEKVEYEFRKPEEALKNLKFHAE